MARLIAVTAHALDQHLERWPGEPSDREQRRFLIATIVSSAISEGRMATREPHFSGNGKRTTGKRRGERDRTLRFAWSREEDQVFLIDRQQTAFVVVTSIDPSSDRDSL